MQREDPDMLEDKVRKSTCLHLGNDSFLCASILLLPGPQSSEIAGRKRITLLPREILQTVRNVSLRRKVAHIPNQAPPRFIYIIIVSSNPW